MARLTAEPGNLVWRVQDGPLAGTWCSTDLPGILVGKARRFVLSTVVLE